MTEPLTDTPERSANADATEPRRALSPAAQRALAEAEARRAAGRDMVVRPGELPPEVNGRKGPEPVRFGDWEKNGIISDF
ncbi:DUF1674 domain-containing protein [Aureimonas jatrophae]|uniref:DUF1674 domain-containing protein n=1 Tax=Aureimonas jatrophae TaxID=1166073 RepID=A0A1H0K990_9HYPH|nr:DUF1674 domain-containing protein [Aureimonas jatrophae]MBB3951004.1 hypothetical protein [Aureimonas jatrophae]SDO52363.1 hypothetical protein SAMN05192530_107152 [Aureimonas jatrophae]